MDSKVQIMAHRAGSRERPNSREAVESVLKLKPNIIELDVRLSKDKELVCYHGNILENLGLYSSTNFRTAAQLNKKGIASLSELLRVINGSCNVFLDIKDYRVTSAQVFGAFNKEPETIYIGARKIGYFRSFGYKPDNVKFCNIYSFGFEYLLRKLKQERVDVVDLFPWMVSKRRVGQIHSAGMNFSLSALFEPSHYLNSAVKLGTSWISVYDILHYRTLLAALI